MLFLLLVLPFLATTAQCLPTEVTVPGYGTFNGTIIDTTDIPQPVTAWLGIEYATQPVGDLRYEIQGPPEAFGGVKQADSYGNICMQGTDEETPDGMGENCLSLNIFRPANVSNSTLLPVGFYIHGGSFNSGSSQDIDSASFIANSKSPIMMVSINYRVGALGFFSSLSMESLGLLNLGFHDQHTALKFVHENIKYFGGDASQITLMGVSAGGHSVGYEYLNIEEDGEPLLARAVMHSGAPTARAYPNASYPIYKTHWNQLISTVGCTDGNATSLLQCLKGVDAGLIRTTSAEIYAASNYNITWPWQPVLDGYLIPRPASESWSKGLFNKLPLLTGFCTNEGNTFAPQNLSTESQFNTFFRTLLPNLTSTHLAELSTLYPDPVANTSISPYVNSPLSPQYSRLGAAYGDYSYICQVQQNALSATAFKVPVYKYHFGQNDSYPAYIGIGHACGAGEYQWNGAGVESRRVGQVYNAWLTSFVATGDPNTYKFDDDVKEWPVYGNDTLQMFVKEGAFGAEFDGMRLEQCRFWESIPKELNH